MACDVSPVAMFFYVSLIWKSRIFSQAGRCQDVFAWKSRFQNLSRSKNYTCFIFIFLDFAPFSLHISIIIGIMDMGVIKPSKCPGHRYALCPINKHQFLTVFCKIRIYLFIRRERRQSSTAASICTAKTSTAWNGTRCFYLRLGLTHYWLQTKYVQSFLISTKVPYSK